MTYHPTHFQWHVEFDKWTITDSDRVVLLSTALKIATEGHSGIFRKDNKTPYIEHPKAVAKIAVEQIEQHRNYIKHNVFNNLSVLVQIVSYFHDLIEDVEKWLNKEDELIKHLESESGINIPDKIREYVVDALKRMNKNNFETYLEFVLSAKLNLLSKYSKIGDLTHNVSDLWKGSLKEKYILSLYIIKQEQSYEVYG